MIYNNFGSIFFFDYILILQINTVHPLLADLSLVLSKLIRLRSWNVYIFRYNFNVFLDRIEKKKQKQKQNESGRKQQRKRINILTITDTRRAIRRIRESAFCAEARLI